MARRNPSHIEIIDGTVFIHTAQGDVAMVDEADLELVAGFAWQSRRQGRTTYLARRYRDGQTIRREALHRRIVAAPDDMAVDHKDGDGLNNRRSNLRVCTMAENSANRAPDLKAASGLAGAYPRPNGRFFSVAGINGRHVYLGDFATAAEAHDAYVKAQQIRPDFRAGR